jgi:uncharacterized protein (TIGR00730 family)
VRIAVFCGSSRRAPADCLAAARVVGDEIARRGHVLVYGGGRTGLMGALADAALAAGGRVRGVILRESIEQDVHHRGVAELTAVDDMRARKAGLESRAEAFVALPGGLGTLEELAEILSFRKLGLHRRPVVALCLRGFFAGFVAQIERGIAEGLDAEEVRGYLRTTSDPAAVVRLCERAAVGKPA